jgi:hypothetical protein
MDKDDDEESGTSKEAEAEEIVPVDIVPEMADLTDPVK